MIDEQARGLAAKAASPAFLRLQGMPSTPENNNLVVDRNGVVDSTSALTSYLANLAANGDFGYLGPGSFKTSAELVATGGASLALQGAGPQRTIIKPAANTYNGLRVALSGGGFGSDTGFVRDIGIAGPGARPTTKNSGFIIDHSPLFKGQGIQVSNFDIGFDFQDSSGVNAGSFNASLDRCTTPRFGTVNVGVYLREGVQSGSDLVFHNCNLNAWLHAACIKGGGGGYTFVGGQWGSQNTAVADANGVIMLGWDYINQAENDGSYGNQFYAVGLEGWMGCHAIRNYGQNKASFRDMHFTATVTGASAALDIFKATDVKNGHFNFDGCEASGTFANAALAAIAGNYGACLNEGPWFFAGGVTTNGVSLDASIASLGEQSGLNLGTGVFGYSSSGGAVPGYMFGNKRVRMAASPTTGHVLEYSTDKGATWTAV